MYSGFFRRSNSVIARVEIFGSAALEEYAAAPLRNRIRGQTIQTQPVSAGPTAARSRKFSGLAVSKTRAAGRSHAENTVVQFRGRAQWTEVQCQTSPTRASLWVLLTDRGAQSRRPESPPIQD